MAPASTRVKETCPSALNGLQPFDDFSIEYRLFDFTHSLLCFAALTFFSVSITSIIMIPQYPDESQPEASHRPAHEASKQRSNPPRPTAPSRLPSDYSTQPPSYHTGAPTPNEEEDERTLDPGPSNWMNSREPEPSQSPSEAKPPSPRSPKKQALPYTLHFTSTKYTSSLTPLASSQALYTASYNRPLLKVSSRPDIIITFAPKDYELATVVFHTFSSKINLIFSLDRIVSYKRKFESCTLGRLEWAVDHAKRKKASIRCLDQAGKPVCTFEVTNKFKNGRLQIWKEDLSWEQFDELVVSGIAEVEMLRRKLDTATGVMNGVPGAVAAGC
ncbi:hypothetical protein LTR96_001152 [Exophiala xenobiotica]|nr:hypothetical protein LTR96_001152 [Exophiala xenobiotica]KAK5560511.1 hypothetical protein LTR46_000819 [Exophiala xenobiotica]